MYGSDQEAGWAEAASSLSAGPLDDPIVSIVARMLRFEGACEKGHRKGALDSEHVHLDTVHGWATALNRAHLGSGATSDGEE